MSLLGSLLTPIGGSGGNLATREVTASGPVTVQSTDCVIIINKTIGAATAVSLPPVKNGKMIIIKDGKGDANANNITVSASIDGGSSYVINTAYGSISLIGYGSKYYVI